MFRNCIALKTIDFKNCDTSKVTNMRALFHCIKLDLYKSIINIFLMFKFVLFKIKQYLCKVG